MGARGYAMGYNYNGRLKSAELLLKGDGSVQLVRQAETLIFKLFAHDYRMIICIYRHFIVLIFPIKNHQTLNFIRNLVMLNSAGGGT